MSEPERPRQRPAPSQGGPSLRRSRVRGGEPLPSPTHRRDVLIVGGGFVGAALACALAQAGLAVAVIEAAAPGALHDASFDGRASAIALTSRRLLTHVGVWDKLKEVAAPMLDIRVADGDSRLFLHYDHRQVGDEPFGHMVENRHLRRALYQRMAELSPTLDLRAPARLTGLTRSATGVVGHLASGETIGAALVVAADGRGSRVRDEAGIRVTSWRYRQSAIVCTVRAEKPHHFVAHEHFLPAGPFAILPLLDNHASLVWTEKEDLAPAILALDEEGFHAQLARRFGDFLGPIEVVGPKWCYPLSLQYAWRATDQRLALIGDAAHAMHPVAGQGVNMGFRDVAALAEAILDRDMLGLDIGAPDVLARFERWRRFDNMLMLGMTDGLVRLFSNDVAPIRLGRDLGLAVVNRLKPLKTFFMRHAMGEIGELPRLMRA